MDSTASVSIVTPINTEQCTGFAWQGFGSGGATGAASLRSCQKFPLCLIEPMSAHSSMDPPLAKDEPIGNDGRVSGPADLRRKKPTQQQLQPERGV